MYEMVKKNTKHGKTIDAVIERLSRTGNYQQISKELEYYNPGSQDVAGEIDVMAFSADFKRNYLLLFEIKSNHTDKQYKKAADQLNKSEEHYKNFANRIYKFYVTPDKKGNPHYQRIK